MSRVVSRELIPKLAYRPRIPQLRALEGWYSAEGTFKPTESVESYYATYTAMKTAGKNVPTFFRWLDKMGLTKLIDPQDITTMAASLKPTRFKISCQYHDILRCGETTHFTSCFRREGSLNHMPQIILQTMPNIALLHVPNARGNFLARTWVVWSDPPESVKQEYRSTKRLWHHGLVLVRPYGDTSWYSILRKLQTLGPVALQNANWYVRELEEREVTTARGYGARALGHQGRHRDFGECPLGTAFTVQVPQNLTICG